MSSELSEQRDQQERPHLVPKPLRPWTRVRKIGHAVAHHCTKHVGAGIIASVAYFDPGNWSVDLQAGSLYGYKLLFVVLLSGLGAVVLQIMSARLGCVTGLDLATHCRILLKNHPRHPRLVRFFVLYPLYAFAQIAIIATDLAELLGSAIGLSLLIPSLPLYGAVLITAVDIFLILLIGDPGSKKSPVRLFEASIIAMVMVVFSCFVVLIVKVQPHWPTVFDGFLPSKDLTKPSALYTAIGILGATVMPHALFLGSSLATLDRVSPEEAELPAPPSRPQRNPARYLKSLFAVRKADNFSSPLRHGDFQNNSLSFVRAHLIHGVIDVAMSLLGFAVVINSAILILAGAVFFYDVDPSMRGTNGPASLFDAYDLIAMRIGKPAAVVFAIALLASGQSASITATLSGQIVSEGFLEFKMSPFLTRFITRTIALLPATLVAAVVGRDGLNAVLVASQVVLSLVLPFIVFPLVFLTSSSYIMRVKAEDKSEPDLNFANGRIMKYLGYLIFVVVLAANVYAIISLIVYGDMGLAN
ncbi:natural resistance-associated macrophage protein [Sistotremastrum niveocremeum HHB9708]|uniref:Natural resistance-associated macrophage protein n=1 Tax=Sistotremastrum niveocremeum HHB9708 TaxID=1314777 RepID=A0A164UBB1_9AGAM|nr:natural resistance-associated macrophage protein [Sistotremastrum niveocremeum HHB9708]